MLSTGTEVEVLTIVGKLGETTTTAISRRIMITPGYAEYLCKYLTKEGYLELTKRGSYRLAPEGAKTLIKMGYISPIWDKEFVKEMAREIAKEISIERGFVREGRRGLEKGIEIKTEFIPPPELEEVEMESNIGQVSTRKEKSPDFEKTLKLFKKVKSSKRREE